MRECKLDIFNHVATLTIPHRYYGAANDLIEEIKKHTFSVLQFAGTGETVIYSTDEQPAMEMIENFINGGEER